MSDVSPVAYRYALAVYAAFGVYIWYLFHSLGLFLGQHVFSQSASGFSVMNPKFSLMNNGISSALTLVILVGLLLNSKLKSYVVDVGDELTRVSWSDYQVTQRSTLMVIAICIVSAIFLFTADVFFVKFINMILASAS